MSLNLIKCQISPPKITRGSIKRYSHIHFTAFTFYPQKLSFILAEITAIPPQEPSMQVMPENLFKRMAGDRTAEQISEKCDRRIRCVHTENRTYARLKMQTFYLTVEWFLQMPSSAFLPLQSPNSPWAYRNILVKIKARICQIWNSFLQSW